ncbi:hypothetical protein HWV62_2374 [Athelia sp. TMB]|nr:hypothetical protein HWV62_2374 [Athelia sp. TMB]
MSAEHAKLLLGKEFLVKVDAASATPYLIDIAFELDFEVFKWKWQPNFLGYKASVELLSQHLIVPLISTNHLAFSSSEPISAMSDQDLEKAVDKMGRVAKRSPDVHIRNALTKPRVATTIGRVASLFYSLSDIPSIRSEVDKPSLVVPSKEQEASAVSEDQPLSPNLIFTDFKITKPMTEVETEIVAVKIPDQSISADSATESDGDSNPIPSGKGKNKAKSVHLSSPAISTQDPNDLTSMASPQPTGHDGNKKEPPSDTESSPVQPAKKKPRQSSSSSEENGNTVPKMTRGGAPPKRGARQPIKRGGKRF